MNRDLFLLKINKLIQNLDNQKFKDIYMKKARDLLSEAILTLGGQPKKSFKIQKIGTPSHPYEAWAVMHDWIREEVFATRRQAVSYINYMRKKQKNLNETKT